MLSEPETYISIVEVRDYPERDISNNSTERKTAPKYSLPKNWKCEKADTVVIDKIDPQDILDKIENGGFDSDNIDLDALLDALPIGDLPKSIRNQIKKELEKAINNGVDGFDDFGGNEGGSGKHGGRGGRH